jgi:DNA-binding NarL/FixJ family response regulator
MDCPTPGRGAGQPSGPAADPAASPGELRVFGRSAELSALGALAVRLASGRGGVAWLQGEPGIGKSALLDVTLARVSALGCQVRRAGGEELMQPFPLRLMADCLGVSARSPNPAAARVARLLSGAPPGSDGRRSGQHDPAGHDRPAGQDDQGHGATGPGPADPVRAAGEQMLELVDRLCAAGPLALAVEDLHWADEPTLALWYRLARAVDQIPLLLFGVARPLPQRDILARLRELTFRQGGLVLDLDPLCPAAAAQLTAGIAGGTPGPRLRAALERAAGNPLYVRELVEALVRDGQVEVSMGVAEIRGEAAETPGGLRGAIGSRLGFLPHEARRALRMAAVLGHEFDPGDLLTVMDLSVTELTDVLSDAIAGGVLCDAGERLRFRHELIHQVLLEETPTAVRRTLHEEFARTLAAAGRDADSVARHLMAVPGTMPNWVLGWLEEIPDSALYAQPQVAAELLGRAVESSGVSGGSGVSGVSGPDDPRWEALAVRLARVLQWLGRDEDARRIGTAVVRHTADATLAVQMRILVIRAAGRTRQFADSDPLCAGPADDSLPPALRAQLGAWSAINLTDAGRAAEGLVMTRDALARAVASGDLLAVACAQHAASSCCLDPVGKITHVKAALAALAARQGGDVESTELRLLLLTNHVSFSVLHAQPEDVEQTLAQALPLADQVRSLHGAAVYAVAAEFCYWYGRWEEAVAYVASIDAQFHGIDRITPYSAIAALVALHREDRGSADVHLASVTGQLCDPSRPRSRLTRALAMRAEAGGDLAEATAMLAGWLPTQVRADVRERFEDLPYLVRLALETGDMVTAKAATAAAAGDAAAHPAAGRAAAAQFCQAQLDDDIDGLLAVASVYLEYGWPLFQAFAHEEAAVRLAAAGDSARARAALTDAVRVYGQLGAGWDIRRADARLRRHGIRRGPRSTHRRAATGWEALTPTEERVARLVAAGLSNPDIATELFMSRRTVQAHVSSILTKLGHRSRLELVRSAHALPPA